MGSKTVAADGTVDVTSGSLVGAIKTADGKIEDALKTTAGAATAYNKTALETELNKAKTAIEKVLEDKNISKTANDVFNSLKDQVVKCIEFNNTANTLKYDSTKAEDHQDNVNAITKLKDLKTGLEDLSTVLQEASDLTNSQMTTLDELRTTLQGFVAKPNDVNLGYASFIL